MLVFSWLTAHAYSEQTLQKPNLSTWSMTMWEILVRASRAHPIYYLPVPDDGVEAHSIACANELMNECSINHFNRLLTCARVWRYFQYARTCIAHGASARQSIETP